MKRKQTLVSDTIEVALFSYARQFFCAMIRYTKVITWQEDRLLPNLHR